MTASYWWRLVWMALACFFLVHLATATVVALATRRATRMAERCQPHLAALALFLLRLFPVGFAVAAVGAVCIPSYLLLEPVGAREQVGWVCLGAASLGILLWADSVWRFLQAIVCSYRHMRRWRTEGGLERVGLARALMIESDVPFVALAGIVRPTLIASRGLLRALSEGQLAAALRHEEGHGVARDNLKRLVIHCAPRILPFVPGFDSIERAWMKFTERAADDWASAGDPAGALLLAEALVRVARTSNPAVASSLVAPLLADASELNVRVGRLLHPAPSAAAGWRPRLAFFLAAGILIAIAIEPLLLRLAHRLLEQLIR